MSTGSAASALAYPFRPGWARAWLVGVPLALVCPLGAIPLLGYAVAVTRAVQAGDAARLPAWRFDLRLLADGALLLLLLLAVTIPCAAAVVPASAAVGARLPIGDAFIARAYGILASGAVLALVWALLCLLVVPPGLARYARSGRVRDLLNPVATVRLLGSSGFWAWNVAGVAIVTAWAVAAFAVCAGAVGAPFAAFYAILVSAHAASPLADRPG